MGKETCGKNDGFSPREASETEVPKSLLRNGLVQKEKKEQIRKQTGGQ